MNNESFSCARQIKESEETFKEGKYDVVLLNSYHRSLFTEFNQSIAEGNFSELESSIEKFLKYGNIIGIVIDDKLVAMLNLYCNNYETKEAYICNVHVINEYRRKGLARNLLKRAYRMCKDNGFLKIILHVAVNNDKAINLYLSEGFLFTGNVKSIGSEITKEMSKKI